MTAADDLVARYITKVYRARQSDMGWATPKDEHLPDCPDLTVQTPEARTERFWDTGVTGCTFTAVMTCQHGHREEFEWSDLGNLPEVLAELEAMEDQQ